MRNVATKPNNALPDTKLESTFRDYFAGRLADFTTSTATTTANGFEDAAAECDRRAKVCETYTDDMKAHRRDPEKVDPPPKPPTWVTEG